jgi:hypothetical protein
LWHEVIVFGLLAATVAGCKSVTATPAAGPSEEGGKVVQAPPWPVTAEPPVPAGFSWQTVRHETLHVRLPVPIGWRVDKARGPYGHPIVRLWEERRDAGARGLFQFVDVTFSAGTGPGELGLLAKKPSYYGLPIERTEHTSETLVVDTHADDHVVRGYARGLSCEARGIRTGAFADQAFRICGALRPAAPGVWRRDPTVQIAIPDEAFVRRDGRAATIYFGPFVVFVRPKHDVPDTFESLRKREVGEVTVNVDRRPLAGGEAYVRSATRDYIGTKYPGDVAVFFSRAGWDCRAIFPAFAARAPAPAEIDYAIALCDTLPPSPSGARGADSR